MSTAGGLRLTRAGDGVEGGDAPRIEVVHVTAPSLRRSVELVPQQSRGSSRPEPQNFRRDHTASTDPP